jgi:prepilin-type N-terminal cleavage/methylation domain-containing protein
MYTKKAFTVMEIIFVIVILGILATVIIPRLATTRDDAKVAFCTEAITLFMRDLSSYYTSQGKFSLNMQNMTNVAVHESIPITDNGSDGEYYYVCNKIKENVSLADSAITFKFSNTADNQGTIRINFNATMTSIQQGTVDGDLGHLLSKKNIATNGVGITHFIAGIRIKR